MSRSPSPSGGGRGVRRFDDNSERGESATLVYRGLDPHTTEFGLEVVTRYRFSLKLCPQQALKGFWPKATRIVRNDRRPNLAFVEFPSIRHSRAALSACSKGGFLVDGAQLSVEFCRGGPRGSSASKGHADWTCDRCSALNFARRTKCFGCGVDRLMNGEEEDMRGRYDSREPTPCLVVYGLSPFAGEADLADAMRSYAPVKDAKLLRNANGQSRGVGFVTFFNNQASAHTLKVSENGKHARVLDKPVALAYTRGAALAQIIAEAAMKQHHYRESPPADHATPADAAVAPGRENDEVEDGEHRRSRSEWPVPFETNTAAYVFDPSSRYFYEPSSSFYYDPKGKIYYSPHTKRYFSYTPHTDPPFSTIPDPQTTVEKVSSEPLLPPPPVETTKRKREAPVVEEASMNKAKRAQTSTGPIVFAPLVLGGGKNKIATSTALVPLAPSREASEIVAVGSDAEQLHRLVVDKKPSVYECPKSGKWLCLISRRQFATHSELKKHVAKSSLYRESLEKAAGEGRIRLVETTTKRRV